MIKHIVLWNVQDGLDKEVVFQELKNKLEGLVGKIDVLLKLEVGFNYNGKETGRDICLYSEFATKEDLEAYIVHPEHVAVGSYVRSVVKDRVDSDCEI